VVKKKKKEQQQEEQQQQRERKKVSAIASNTPRLTLVSTSIWNALVWAARAPPGIKNSSGNRRNES
jgi:hypothetical protein